MLNINTIKRIHFIGIGGIGMSALARFFLAEKKMVSGSDRSTSKITEALAKEGVVIFASQSAGNISPDVDIVVYTEAMPKDHEEMIAARALGVPMVNYFEALGLMVNPYYLIAVAGTHGKTTTTAMIADVLEEADLDPTVIVGSLRSKTGSNFRHGRSKYAVVEACEYKRDFLHLRPEILVITNLEFEHVDYYKDLADVQDAFRTLAGSVPETGFIVTDTSDENIKPVLEGVVAKVIDYRQYIDLHLSLHQPGLHNRLNAAAVRAVGECLAVESKVITSALENFAGTWRRFEYKGAFVNDNGRVLVYDDYGHHPTEVAATIAGTRELYPNHHLTVVFQSHTYSRTAELFADFVRALGKADRVVLLPIYAAREENVSGVSSEKLAAAITDSGAEAISFLTTGAVVEDVREKALAEGVVLVMGAGDMTTRVAEQLVESKSV